MNEKELSKKKAAEKEKIRKLGLKKVAESNQLRLQTEQTAEKNFRQMEQAIKDLERIDDWLQQQQSHETPKKPNLHLVPPLKKNDPPIK